jgi:HEAT repeat protein
MRRFRPAASEPSRFPPVLVVLLNPEGREVLMQNQLKHSMGPLHSNCQSARVRSLLKILRLFGIPAIAAVAVVALSPPAARAQQEFEGWNLEPGVAKAHLVMVARVARISRLTVVEGAKTDVSLREYRFQPVRRLKGIFQRDELSMTAADLGAPADDASIPPPLREGEFRLLILVQQQGLQSMGCVSAAPGATTFDERVPLLNGPDDPLVSAVETLIQVADSRSRRERAALLVRRLNELDGLAAVPVLTSLRLRADWAGAEPGALASLARLARDPRPAVRGASLEVLRDVLATPHATDDSGQLDVAGDALRAVLESNEAATPIRVAALEALERLLAPKPEINWACELLLAQMKSAATHAERMAAAAALGEVAAPEAVAEVSNALADLPLDESPAREAVYVRAAVRLDRTAAERVLLSRLDRSIAARQSLQAEIEPLGQMRSQESLPLLLSAAARSDLSRTDRQCVARALGRLGDDRAAPVLSGWMRGSDFQLKGLALTALEQLDSPVAAREARPLLKSEAHLPFKLRIARLLARQGIADGYALATEHLADARYTAQAALVLAALEDPRTADELAAILAARPDRSWHAAALAGLAAIGDGAARRQLLEILADDRHPLSADAAEAAGLAADPDLLPPLAALMRSRNKRIALASLMAVRRFFSGVRSSPFGLAAVDRAGQQAVAPKGEADDLLQPPGDVPQPTRAALAEAAASLAVDAYVETDVRKEAFLVSKLLGGERYDKLLTELVDQAELEGSPLLAEIQAERRLRFAAKSR